MHFADALMARTKQTSPVCVGLDPQLGRLPPSIPKDIEGTKVFCEGIIDATKNIACATKINIAFFEVLGWQGIKVFWELSAYAKEQGLIVIADAKRGDIGSTCEAYADAYLYEGSPVDALTVSPYLGSDSVQPFIDRCVKNAKGIFVLVKTSNPGSGDLQDLPVGDEVVHEHMAQLVESWAAQHPGTETSLSCIGAVVGATYPEEMTYLRTLMPHVPFLIPGYGAQGGTATDVARGFIPNPPERTSVRAGGTGAIVNASRSIIYAGSGPDWREAARTAAEKMAAELAAALRK